MWTVKDYQFMSQAIQLAKNGQFTCDPNPIVGCVIIKDDIVVSEGWHAMSGKPHAEINALNACKNSDGSTMYVTLEPCNHESYNGSCANQIIRTGIKNIYTYRLFKKKNLHMVKAAQEFTKKNLDLNNCPTETNIYISQKKLEFAKKE